MPWLIALGGCGDDSSAEPDAAMTGSEPDGALADGGYSCTPASDCQDLHIADQFSKACCSPVETCGYELPEVDEETLMLFPMIVDVRAMLTEGDPAGKCVPSSFYFGPRPGLWEHRVETEGGEDILITPDCESYTLLAFILPGCCLPDDTCGLSTDESWPTLESLAQGVDAPFNRPECVSAEVLNQQFRDSVVLEQFARTTAMGSCNHADLDARLSE